MDILGREDGVKQVWQAKGRGGKEAREEEKVLQTNRQELTGGLGKGKIKGRKSTISDNKVLEF